MSMTLWDKVTWIPFPGYNKSLIWVLNR